MPNGRKFPALVFCFCFSVLVVCVVRTTSSRDVMGWEIGLLCSVGNTIFHIFKPPDCQSNCLSYTFFSPAAVNMSHVGLSLAYQYCLSCVTVQVGSIVQHRWTKNWDEFTLSTFLSKASFNYSKMQLSFLAQTIHCDSMRFSSVFLFESNMSVIIIF